MIAEGATAATPLLDRSMPALLEPGLYHADGQIDGEVFEVGSFMQSRMFAAGVTCTNCHDPHAGGLRASGNGLCAQCHMPQKFDVAEHHHHAPGSSGAQCAACHMPAKTYMGVDLRRDHSFRVPRPDMTEKIGAPNTCNACHADRTPAWAASTVAGWYPHGRQTTPHYGTALHAGRVGAIDAEAQLDALILDRARRRWREPAPCLCWRASPRRHPRRRSRRRSLIRMRWFGWRCLVPCRPICRRAMVRGVAPLLSDPVRAVRIETARALAGADPQAMTPDQRTALAKAIQELVAAEMIDADRPEAHLNLGLLDLRQGRPAEAEAQYETALRLDSAFVPAMVNMADLDRARGMDQQGADLLRKAMAIEPANAAVRHSLGLLLVRQRKYNEALEQLRRASELAPDNTRYAYVYAIALNSTGAPAEAMEVAGAGAPAAPDGSRRAPGTRVDGARCERCADGIAARARTADAGSRGPATARDDCGSREAAGSVARSSSVVVGPITPPWIRTSRLPEAKQVRSLVIPAKAGTQSPPGSEHPLSRG